MTLYKNRFRIESARLQDWDYSSNGIYFITICTHGRRHYFGTIENHEMKLSPMGILADVLWYEIKNHADNVELGEFIVMPNHIHGIVIIKNRMSQSVTGTDRYQNQGNNTVSSIIGSYKSAVSKHGHRLGYTFRWQSRFHDVIVRDQNRYQRIRNYIVKNPHHWDDDCHKT